MSVPKNLYGFVLQETCEYKDCGHTGYLYKNEKFGCPFLYIRTEDTNNFFSVHIRTPEEDNTGISHMLEHLSLRGSEKYPIRRVFFELNKRSYSTFMNAFTTSEYTVFPFSSTNQTDFLNILDVYLDCVYHPKLTEVSFLSECHHLLFEDGDPNKPLMHGGVVYNEVVGSYSKQATIFHQKVIENLYPDSPSRFDCGGTPSDIPKATYDSIVHHHQQYYHPVNSFFYFYGNKSFSMELVFQKVSEVIDQFKVIESPYHPELYQMKPWTEPRSITVDAPSDEKTPVEEQYQMMVSYVIDENCTNDILLCNLDFLVSMLGTTNNSPLYQSLVIPGLVKGVTMSLDTNTLYPAISVTATGYKKENSEKIEKIIFDVIQKFSEETSEKANEELFERIECYYHSIKLSNKKVPENFGLILFQGFAEQWIHGSNPLKLIDFNSNLEESYNCCKKEGYLRSLAKRFLVDNKHCLISRLNPVSGYNEKQIGDEKKQLQDLQKSLSETQIKQILDNMKKIEIDQSQPQPIHLLPQIHRSDLSKSSEFKKADFVYKDLIDVFLNPTDGVVYVTVFITVDKIDIPNLFLLPFMSIINNSVGAGQFDEYELTLFIQRWFLALDSQATFENSIDGKKTIRLMINAASLNEDLQKLNESMKMIALETRWNNSQKVEIIVNQSKFVLGKLLSESIDSINSTRAGALLNKENAFEEAVSGLIGLNKFYNFLNEKSVDEIIEACETLYKQILTNGTIRSCVACSEEMKDSVCSAVEDVILKIQSVQKIEYKPFDYSVEIFEKVKSKKTFFNWHVQTGAVALKKFCVKVDQVKTSVCLSILATILTNEAVLDQVREKLGAYSGHALFTPRTGVFAIWTYKDSVPTKSYKYLLEIIENINDYITDESVERAVVSFLSSADAPQSPPVKGLDFDISGITYDYLQKRRDVFLSATADDVKEAAKYLTDGEFNVSIAADSNLSEPPDGFDVINV